MLGKSVELGVEGLESGNSVNCRGVEDTGFTESCNKVSCRAPRGSSSSEDIEGFGDPVAAKS